MKVFKLLLILIFTLSIILSSSLLAQDKKEIKKDYEAKEKIKIDLALGSCSIKNSNDGRIHVHVVYSYDDESFEPRFREKSNTLYLEEKFYGDTPRGRSDWKLQIPQDIKIDFNSGIGDLYIEGKSAEIEGNTGTGTIEITLAQSEFDLNSGTGNIEVVDSEGDFALNSGTGRVKIKNSKGDFKANSGTGNVEASVITIISDGNFNSGTGDAEVKSPKGDDFDLSINIYQRKRYAQVLYKHGYRPSRA